MKKQLARTLLLVTFLVGHIDSANAASDNMITPFKAHDGFGATVDENKNRLLPYLRAHRDDRVSVTSIPDLKTWPGTNKAYSDLEVAVSPNTQWAFNLYRPKAKDLTDLSPSGHLEWRNIGIRPGDGAVGLKWGSREYNAPDRRFIDCDYTDIPKEHGLYVSNSGNTLLERCTFLRVGSQGAQWAHRPCPYQQYFADNAPYQSPPLHVVRDCHFVDCAYRGDRPSFNLTYFSPGTSENPGTLLIEDSSFVCKWDKPRIDNPNSAAPRIRYSTGAIVVTPSQGNLPLDPAKGQMMKRVTLRNCLFDYTAGDRAIAELRSIDEIVIEDCCFIARDHTQNGINIDRLSGPKTILDGTKSQRLVLRNNLADNVVVRLGLADGTRNTNFVTIRLHTPGEEVIYNAVTGQEISRRSVRRRSTDTGQVARSTMAFGRGGQIKMLYDRRQRPQAVCLNDKLHIVFNAGGKVGAEPRARTKPMAVTYNPHTRQFSEIVTLGPAKSDHHYCPVIWADTDNYLHILFGCHRTPGTHLISKQPAGIGTSLDAWAPGPQIAPGISYPTFFRICDDKQLIYYRTAGHTSSWTYRITDDNGQTWTGPPTDVTDMDIKGRTEWSSYHTVLPSRNGRLLHAAFIAYDDNKSNDPNRYYNPRYKQPVDNDWKYNLYYVKVDLQTHEVTNSDGEPMNTPIDIEQADTKCRIWDTQRRGAGVPPTIALDENADPAFLHVLSEDTLEDHRYYYVRRSDGKWKHTPITRSNHQWDSCHLTRDDAGVLHAYLIVGDGYLDTGGHMDSYGGGTIEEWISRDKGNTWRRHRDLTPDRSKYPGWKYNNIQPVTKPDGTVLENMLLFYGWKDEDAPEAKAFLLHDPAAQIR